MDIENAEDKQQQQTSPLLVGALVWNAILTVGFIVLWIGSSSPFSVDGNTVSLKGMSLAVVDGNIEVYTADVSTKAGNLIVGTGHKFDDARNSFVAGLMNTVSGEGLSVSGGFSNEARGFGTAVSGGFRNLASVNGSSVTGGAGGQAIALASTVSGGSGNSASGVGSTVSSGTRNQAPGYLSNIAGGHACVASGEHASVSGGFRNTVTEHWGSIVGGRNNVANGWAATIVGGKYNVADGQSSVVVGGRQNNAKGIASVVSSGYYQNTTGFFGFYAAAVEVGENDTCGDQESGYDRGPRPWPGCPDTTDNPYAPNYPVPEADILSMFAAVI